LILATGAAAHALAFKRALAALATVKLSAGMAGSFKALWLADSTTCLTVAAIFAFIAVRPSRIAGGLAMLVALIPAFTGIFIYEFLGNFYAGHMMVLAAASAFIAGLLLRQPPLLDLHKHGVLGIDHLHDRSSRVL
jgi:hypothetical protein